MRRALRYTTRFFEFATCFFRFTLPAPATGGFGSSGFGHTVSLLIAHFVFPQLHVRFFSGFTLSLLCARVQFCRALATRSSAHDGPLFRFSRCASALPRRARFPRHRAHSCALRGLRDLYRFTFPPAPEYSGCCASTLQRQFVRPEIASRLWCASKFVFLVRTQSSAVSIPASKKLLYRDPI